MSKLSPKQETIVDERNKNIIVSAAAGSGKTTVLVERVLDLVIKDWDNNNQVDIDTMIIVTFTNKASAEMRTRIQNELQKRYQEADGPLKMYLKGQLKKLRQTPIKTLHSFCGDMLREYFHNLDGLSPNFKIYDQRRSDILKVDAIDEVFENNYEHITDGFRVFVNNFRDKRSDEDAKDVVLFAYEKLVNQIDMDKARERYFDGAVSVSEFRKNSYKALVSIPRQIEALKLMPDYDLTSEKFRSFIDAEKESVETLAQKYSNASTDDITWQAFVDDMTNHKFESIKRDSKKKESEAQFKKNTDTNRKKYKDNFDAIKYSALDSLNEDYGMINDLSNTILIELEKLVFEFKDIYEGKKRDANALDFSDLEHKFLELLDSKNAYDDIRDRFNYIFFDEYQDANDIQNAIVNKLQKGNNLFFVGDVKQSIYGFRRANPELFLEKLETYKTDPNSVRMDLDENFRTEKDILEFNNYLFDRLMTKENSGIDYKNDNHRLNFVKNKDDRKNKVEIDLVGKDDDPNDAIAQRVIELKNNENYDYKDIMILLRANKDKALKIEKALKKAGIPVKNEIENTESVEVEVEFFLNLLKLIANPYDDITMLSVLRSEIFGFDENDIARIKLFSSFSRFNEAFYEYERTYNRASKQGALYDIDKYEDPFKKYKNFEFFDPELGDRVISFISIYKQLRYELSIRDLFDFGNFLFEATGYYGFLKARDRATERIANVEQLIEVMGDFDKNNDNGLYGFLKYYDDLTKSDSSYKEGRALTDSENFVRIMTVHKSKGLESKVVILADASRTIKNKDAEKNYIFHQDIGFGFKLVDRTYMVRVPSINFAVIEDRVMDDILKEEMRILYVALTRAENKLIISAKVGDIDKSLRDTKSKDYKELRSYIDWIVKALPDEHFSFDDNLDNNLDLAGIVKVNMGYEAKDKDQMEENLVDYIATDADNAYYNDMVKNFSEYEYYNSIKDPLKKSVTELSKNYIREDTETEELAKWTFNKSVEFKTPNFMTDEISYKAMEKGTIIHKVFQSLPFKAYSKEELEKELENLIDKNMIKREDLKVIELDKFLNFYNNDKILGLNKDAKNIISEESFLMKYENKKNKEDYYYINGQIDLMFEYDDHYVLLDFKTDKKKNIESYRKQIEYYKNAIESAKGKKVTESVIYWYNFNEFTNY